MKSTFMDLFIREVRYFTYHSTCLIYFQKKQMELERWHERALMAYDEPADKLTLEIIFA